MHITCNAFAVFAAQLLHPEKNRKFFKDERDRASLQPDLSYHSMVSAAVGLQEQPASAIATKLLRVVTNKQKGPITCMQVSEDLHAVASPLIAYAAPCSRALGMN